MAKGSSVINYLLIALLMFSLGFYMGGAGCGQQPGGDSAPKAAKPEAKKAEMKPELKKAQPAEERFKVEVGNSYTKGPADALVTLVEFTEFQCPFCSRVTGTVDKIFETYGDKVRLVFKHNPLPFHKDAGPASEAALAAGEQGKFWEMYKVLFANQKALSRENLDKYAQQIGLDMGKYKAAMDSGKFKKVIEQDQKQAQQFAARGTPHFFINGIRLRGAQPFEKFKEVIDTELAKAEAIKAKGVKDVYAEVIKNAQTKAEAPKRQQPQEDKTVYNVPTGNGPVKGNVGGALITIVEFSEFQCPFCSRVEPTITKILDEYKDQVRVYFRSNPLPFHKDAMPASKAALAAHRQGKFWEMHKLLFTEQKNLKEETFLKFAKQLGLNISKFKKDMADPAIENQIKEDMAIAAKFGSRGTPGFFINGRKFSGAQPFDNFKKLIDELLPVAKKVGKTGDALYAELTKNGKDKAAPPPNKNKRPQEDPNKVYTVPAGNSHFMGGKNAKVEIIEFSEFQCPFCSRVIPTIKKIKETYGDKVKVVFKHNPLPFHKDAGLASEAALAAGEQGKFWQMHDKLFENQKQLKRENLESYAKELGLNMAQFKKALDSGKFKPVIDADKKLAASVGARGTPTFFINGKKFVGAQPFENFKQKIDEALK